MRISIAFFTFLLGLSVSVAQDTGTSTTATLHQLNVIVDSVRAGKVRRVEILQIPPELYTNVAITPDVLERNYYYKLTIRDIQRTSYEGGMATALASVSASAGGEMPDLRWGIIFFDEVDKRIGSLYFDSAGTRGAIDSMPVAFSGDLARWLRQNFQDVFK